MYKKLFDDDKNYDLTTGTSFKGYLFPVKYAELEEVFGVPTYEEPSGDNKVQKEWVFQDEKGNVFTIYDWKTYNAEYTMSENTRWHVGGKTPAYDFINFVEVMINQHRTRN